jgi:hypothetical protein
MTPILYAKIGVILAVMIAIVAGSYHVGAMAATARLEALQAAQSELTAKAVLAERASAQAESVRLNKVISDYESTPIDPVSVGVAHRVLIYAHTPSCAVPEAGSNPGGTVSTGPKPGGLEGPLQDYIDACSRDAKRLDALIEAWPR